jgi:omega-amidase
MRAHLVQPDIAWEDKAENYARTERLLDAAKPAQGDFALLAEMFDTGFSFNLERTSDADGSTLGFLRALARRYGVTLQGSRSVLGPDGRGRNRFSCIGPDGSLLAEYDKVHPFSLGRTTEAETFTSGGRVVTYAWTRPGGGSVTVCPAICYDLRFPELFRRGMLMGAELFAIGANWPTSRHAHRRALDIARAIENQAVVLDVNRVGADPNVVYGGGTIAVGPRGDVMGELGDQPGVLSVEIDLDDLRDWRRKFPAIRDHRLLGPA